VRGGIDAFGLIAAASLAGTMAAVEIRDEPAIGKSRRPAKKQPTAAGAPELNRHTGQPHQHAREIARRVRQGK
jgi:hypothetical protein